jgi:hypothetical protein
VATGLVVSPLALVSVLPLLPAHHVRSTDREMLNIVELGAHRSTLFRALVERLDGSDVFVYLEPSRTISGGCLRFAAASPRGRYLRVLIGPERDMNQLLALIAHELEHAAEVAQSVDVVDEATFNALFARIGRSHCGDRHPCYETTAAVDVAGRVYRELCGRSVPAEGLSCNLR